MSRRSKPHDHVKPYVYEDVFAKSLHFSVHEIQSRMRHHQPDGLDLNYTRTMMAFLLFVPRPEGIAMVGLGGGSLAKFCHRHLARAHMDVVEINPHVIALRDEFGIPPDGERFRVIAADGAQYMQDIALRYDVLLLDGFDDQGLPRQLASQSFYQACHHALRPGGVLAANFPPSAAGAHRAIRRLKKVFGAATLVIQPNEDENAIVLAFKPATECAAPPKRLGIMSRPWGMDDEAWGHLMPVFASVAKAWNAHIDVVRQPS